MDKVKLRAIRKDFRTEIDVRKMDKDEMPDDGIVYYCDYDGGNIYNEDELIILTPHEINGDK